MRLFCCQLAGELVKLLARKRTYIGFAAFLGAEIVILILLHLDISKASIRKVLVANGYLFEDYYSALTLSLSIVIVSVLLLGGLYLALVSGDIVAKEVEEGNLRLVLCRPITRLRLLAVKYTACVIYTFVLVAFIALTALIVGLFERGWGGGLFVYAKEENLFSLFEFEEGMLRYLAGIPLLALSLVTVSSIGFMLSCMRMKPAAATIVTLTILFIDMVLRHMPWFANFQHLFLTARTAVWSQIFQPYIPWPLMLESYAILMAINATCFVVGWWVFEGRDFKT